MKVSVILETYNQEKFIVQSVEHALMQEADFEYEIIILEDCSTDDTRRIVMDFQKRYPEKIKLVLSEKNRNDFRNFTIAVNTCRSQFIATLDGDDYWISPRKLQKQVDFLETHSEAAICFHDVSVVDEAGCPKPHWPRPTNRKPVTTLDDLWSGCYISGSSAMFRRGLFKRLPQWYQTSEFGDWELFIFLAHFGDIGYIDQVLGVYRVHEGGDWSGLSRVEQLQSNIRFYEHMDSSLKYRCHKRIRGMISWYMYDLAEAYKKKGEIRKGRHCLFRACLGRRFINRHIILRKGFLRLCLGLFAGRGN